MFKSRTAILVAAAAMLGTMAQRASAGAASSATISDSQLNPTTYQYNLTLDNGSASTSVIGTFWYGWIPGQDYMGVSPTNITSPTGWTETVTNNGNTDGYAIQWKATSNTFDLAAGSLLTGFSYQSTDTPSVEFGNSPFYPSTPTGTSFTYSGGPFVGTSDEFVVTPVSVPEPALLGIAIPSLLLLRRRRLSGRRGE